MNQQHPTVSSQARQDGTGTGNVASFEERHGTIGSASVQHGTHRHSLHHAHGDPTDNTPDSLPHPHHEPERHNRSAQAQLSNINTSGSLAGSSTIINADTYDVAHNQTRRWAYSSKTASFTGGRHLRATSPHHSPLPSANSQNSSEGNSSGGSLGLNLGLSPTPKIRESVRRSGHLLRRTSSFGGGPLLVRTIVPAWQPESDAPSAALAAATNESAATSTLVAADTTRRPTAMSGAGVDQSNNSIRWTALALSCFLLFGNYYAYDNPAALNRPLQQFLGHDYDLWQYELNMLYAVYSFPNMFLPFLAGSLVDWLDPSIVLLLFSSIICLGQTLFSIGVSSRHFGIMLCGRVLFGIGGETISVVQSSITTSYFKNRELAFALGLNLCISRLGSVVNSTLSPRIAVHTDASVAVWCGTIACYISMLCSMILSVIIATRPPDPSSPLISSAQLPSTEEERVPLLNDVAEVQSPIGDDRAPPDLPGHSALTDPSPMPTIQPLLKAKPSISLFSMISSMFDGVGLLPPAFWIVCIVCIMLYGTVVPFNNIASDFLMSKWYPNDTQTAGMIMSIPDSMSAILVPLFGILVDRYGGRASVLFACSIVIIFVHLTLGLTMTNPVLPLIVLGVSYSLYGVAIWPSVATVTQRREEELKDKYPDAPPPRLLGTAFGISTSALNASLTIMPLAAAQIRVVGGSFMPVEMFFSGLAVVGAIFCIILWIVDARNGGSLQSPEIVLDSPRIAARVSLHDDNLGDMAPGKANQPTDGEDEILVGAESIAGVD